MVNIIPARPSFASQLIQSVGNSLPGVVQALGAAHKKRGDVKSNEKLALELGYKPELAKELSKRPEFFEKYALEGLKASKGKGAAGGGGTNGEWVQPHPFDVERYGEKLATIHANANPGRQTDIESSFRQALDRRDGDRVAAQRDVLGEYRNEGAALGAPQQQMPSLKQVVGPPQPGMEPLQRPEMEEIPQEEFGMPQEEMEPALSPPLPAKAPVEKTPRTKKERVEQEDAERQYEFDLAKQRRSLNDTHYKEDVTNPRKAGKEGLRLIKTLRGYEASGKLPKGIERVFVHPVTGDLLLPAGVSEEAQAYIKTIQEFMKNMKNIFGSKVSENEVRWFLKGVPTLANSKEGRELIYNQMETFLNIAMAESDEIDKYVEEKGGYAYVDWDDVLRQAEKRSAPRVEELEQKLYGQKQILDKQISAKKEEIRNRIPKTDAELAHLRSQIPKGNIMVWSPQMGTGNITPEEYLKLKDAGEEVEII